MISACQQGQAGYDCFGLTLVLTSRCNLRCSYCYGGPSRRRVMPRQVAHRSIGRALNSLGPTGRLELGFFGGEPLLEAPFLLELADHARGQAAGRGKGLSMQVTTNGTIDTPAAWQVMLAPDIDLAVSCDGVAAAHDRHRTTAAGAGSHETVLRTLGRLLGEGKKVYVVSVVRPDTLDLLPESLELFRHMGVLSVFPSLDLWTQWTRADLDRLDAVVARCADLWGRAHGEFCVGWFDDMAGKLAELKIERCSRCAFGAGEIAVSPAGNLYPCERLIGEDRDDNPQRLAGTAMAGEDFLGYRPLPAAGLPECESCTIRHACTTFCRCSNYVRTGDPCRPDALLCQLNQMCFRAVSRVLMGKAEPAAKAGEKPVAKEPAKGSAKGSAAPGPTGEGKGER